MGRYADRFATIGNGRHRSDRDNLGCLGREAVECMDFVGSGSNADPADRRAASSAPEPWVVTTPGPDRAAPQVCVRTHRGPGIIGTESQLRHAPLLLAA